MRSSFFLGFGIALVVFALAATYFYRYELDMIPTKEAVIADELNNALIEGRARELGMDYPTEAPQISSDEIVQRARDLGMDFPEPSTSPKPSETAEPEVSDEPDESEEPDEPEEPSSSEEPEESEEPAEPLRFTETEDGRITVIISSGMKSDEIAELFYDAGIVSDYGGFSRYIISRGITRAILTGEYSFAPGTAYDIIVDEIS